MRAMRTCAKKNECVNAPAGPFTTFTHYADGTPAAPPMRMMRNLRSGTGGIAQFHVDVDFQEPYPTNATVYGVSSPGGTAYVDDMITRDEYMDYTSIWSSNIIYVTTLDPKPAFCTNVAGVLILKMRCDDHGVLRVGDFAVTNAWPNREYAKAWKVIEANTTNVVDATWDSRDGGKWNFDYECYFYPEKPRPQVVCNPWIGLDRTGDPREPYVSSNVVATAFFTPSNPAPDSVTWQYSGICDQQTETPLSLTLWTTSRESASASYRDQKITALTQDSLHISKNFTIVKVDVVVGNVTNEVDEIETGAFVPYLPDGTNALIYQEWTNNLVDVRFSCEPSNLPLEEVLEISNIGRGELYEQLEDKSLVLITTTNYPACEIANHRFKLLGHDVSTNFMGETVSVIHRSSGAIDEAPYTILNKPKLIPDYNRDGSIDADDEALYDSGRVFRFWINDDQDNKGGSEYDGNPSTDIPKIQPETFLWCFNLKKPDWKTDKVNGYRDLIDFTPLFMDVSTINILPQNIKDRLSFRLCHSTEALNVVWTMLPREYAGSFQTQLVTVCGETFDKLSYTAPKERIKSKGIEVPYLLRVAMKSTASSNGVVMVEGQNSTLEPLRLEIDLDDRMILDCKLEAKISTVEDMYRWLNVRGLSDETGGRETSTNTPPNMPDAETSNKHLVFFHGVNVTKDGARGWAAEIFKRMWQSGMTAKFTAVTWRSDIGSNANYQENASNAFVVASQIASTVNELPGEKVMMAHSLGNMVVSSMIQDYDLQVSKYLMCNSAVPAEAYDTNLTPTNVLVHKDWNEYPRKAFANEWYKCFEEDAGDDRQLLTWGGRFADVADYAVNFYSTGDHVLELEQNNNVWAIDGYENWDQKFEHYSWHKQELWKGRKDKVARMGTTDWAGWGIRENLLGHNIIQPTNAWLMSLAELKTNTVFKLQPETMNTNSIPLLLRGALLAKGISSRTPASGATKWGPLSMNDSMYNLNSTNTTENGMSRPNGWILRPNGLFGDWGDRWLHSDVKDMAYFYVFKFFERIKEEGELE